MSGHANRTAGIGLAILEHHEAIIRAWEDCARAEHAQPCPEHRSELRDSLPQFLIRLGESLRDGREESPRSIAAEHGTQRWEIGWNVAALTRDYMVLRRVLLAHLHRAVALDADDVVALSAALDEAVAESVTAYVEHRELELLQRNEALRRKNYELKRFAHMVAHEVRNPLNLITMAAGTLRRRLEQSEQPPAGAAAALDRIAEGHGQVVEVLDNLVHYASSVDGGEPGAEPVELEAVYDEAVDQLRYLIQASDAAVTRGPLPVVRGDPVALRSVFQNIIENALKYAGDKPPRVHVSARALPGEAHGATQNGHAGTTGNTTQGTDTHNGVLAPAKPDASRPDRQVEPRPIGQGRPGANASAPAPARAPAWWAIDFRDEGIGIARDDQSRLFRFLSRVNVSSDVAGTGVGLALCRRIAEQHGGAITVASTPGQGSTFTLRLPGGGKGIGD